MREYIYFLLFASICSQALAEEDVAIIQNNLLQVPIEQLANMEVSSASKIAGQISAASSAVSIVTAQDIKDYGYHTLAEILESMRGLYTTNDRAYSFLGGRGFGRPGDFTGRIMLLLDGNQVNNNVYNSAGLGYTGIIDASLIERVEYVSGPGSTMYGNNAFFGIINVITKQGHDVNGLKITGEVASYNSRDIKINYGKRLDNGAEILLSASGFNSDGQSLFYPGAVSATSDGVARGLDGQKSQHFFGKMELDGWFAELAYSKRKKDIPTAPYSADFNAPYHYEDTTLEGSIRHDSQLNNHLQMSLRTYYGNYEYKGLTTYVTPYDEKSTGQWWGINAQFVGTWFQNQRILFGTEYRDDFEQDLSIKYAGASVLDSKNNEKTLSLYAQDEIRLSQHWISNIGARYDLNRDAEGDRHNNFSPRLALIYSPLESTTLKLSWSTAFRRGNPFEEYYTDQSSQFQNKALKPERIEATELVAEHHFDKDTRLLGSIYHYQTEDYIRNENRPSGGGKQFQNIKGSSTDGAEIEFEKHWDSDIRLRTSAAYQNAKPGDNSLPINSPRNIGKLNISTPLFNANWRAAFEVQAYSKRYTEDTTSTSGFSLSNLTISADKLLPNLNVAFGIRNLFDRNYVNVAPKSNNLPSSQNPLNTIPQDGRTYWLRMTYDFK